MRAVNLIPREDRRGGGPSLGVYAVLGVLAALVLGVTVYVLTANRVADRKQELAAVSRQAETARQRVAALEPYRRFAQLEADRVSTVRSLVRSRFDWDRALRDVARVTTREVWLSDVTGTVNPTVTIANAGSGDSSGLRAAMPNPALELTGCATTNAALARFMSRARAMTGVVRVTLADAAKSDTATGSASAGTTSVGSTGTCGATDHWPQFHLVVFFAAPDAGQAAPGTSLTPGGATPASASAPSTTTTTTAGSAP